MDKKKFLNSFKEVLIDYLMDEIEKKKKKSNRSRYLEPDGRFKVMTCPDNPKKKSRFCGCVRYMMSQGKSLESAKRICGYIKHYVKKSEYKRLKRELMSEISKSTRIDRKFVNMLFEKALAAIRKDGELDEVDSMLVAGWFVLRRV